MHQHHAPSSRRLIPDWIPTGASRRACVSLACFLCGILIGLEIVRANITTLTSIMRTPLLLLGVVCAMIALVVPTRPLIARTLLACAMVAFGIAHTVARLGAWPVDSIAHHIAAQNDPNNPALVDVAGIVVSAARVNRHDDIAMVPTPDTLVLDVALLRSAHAPDRRVSGIARVHVDLPGAFDVSEIRARYQIGSPVRITGRAHLPPPPMNPGERDTRLLKRQDGIVCSIGVPNPQLVTPAPDLRVSLRTRLTSGALLARSQLRHRASAWMDRTFGDGDTSSDLLRALVLGERTDTDDQRAFARTGVAHLLAISGFHLAVLAKLVRLCVRATGDRGRVEPLITICMVLVYVALVPANPPIVRAAILVVSLMLAEVLGRRYEPIAVLAWTACVMLVFKPLDAFDMGFQLTFSLVAALIVLTPMIAARFDADVIVGRPGEVPKKTPLQWIGALARTLFVTNLMCWLIATPIVMYHVGMVSVVGVVTTIVVGPIVVVVLVLGAIMLVASTISAALGSMVADGALAPAGLAVRIVHALDAIPGSSVRVPAVPLAWTVCAVAIACAWTGRSAAFPRQHRLAFSLVTACLLGWCASEFFGATRLSKPVALRIDTLAVGDGTCHIIRSGKDAMVWDCGSLQYDIGRRMVPSAVRAVGAWRIPTAILTHANIDHYNGLASCAGEIGLQRVLVTQRFLDAADAHPHGAAAQALSTLKHSKIDIRTVAQGDTIPFGSMQIRVLWPPKDDARTGRLTADNDTSIVAIFEPATPSRQGPTLLMTGDIQRAAMVQIMAANPELRADVLELPHHGSYSDVAHEFVGMVDPKIVLQSTGVQRASEPRWERAKHSRRWFATPITGAISTETLRDGTWRTRTVRTDEDPIKDP